MATGFGGSVLSAQPFDGTHRVISLSRAIFAAATLVVVAMGRRTDA